MITEDSVHHNCLFFGRDENGVIRSCALRGSTDVKFRGEAPGGDKSCTFAMAGNNDVLRLFESPIDAMSHATFTKLLGKDWTADHRLSVNGSGNYENIKRYLTNHTEIKSVWFCYDSDQAGHDGAEASSSRIFEDFPDRELSVMSCSPVKNKDWNEALQLFRVLESHGVAVREFLAPTEFRSIPPPDYDENEFDFEP